MYALNVQDSCFPTTGFNPVTSVIDDRVVVVINDTSISTVTGLALSRNGKFLYVVDKAYIKKL